MNIKTMTAYAEVKILWTKMCRAMNVDPNALFVAGVPTTAPYYREYNDAMTRYQQAVLEERAAQVKGTILEKTVQS